MLLDMALSNIFPIVLDLIFSSGTPPTRVTHCQLTLCAAVYLATAPRMSGYYAVLMIGTLAVYVLVTIVIVERRKGLREARNAKWDAAEHVAVDSLLNFETVKAPPPQPPRRADTSRKSPPPQAFGAERQEAERYGAKVKAAQRSDIPCDASAAGLNAAQASGTQ